MQTMVEVSVGRVKKPMLEHWFPEWSGLICGHDVQCSRSLEGSNVRPEEMSFAGVLRCR